MERLKKLLNVNRNLTLLIHIKSIKKIEAIHTRRYTIIKGLKYFRRTSTKKKLDPQNSPNNETNNQSLFAINYYNNFIKLLNI